MNVTGPKNKPETVSYIVISKPIRTSSKQLKLVKENNSWPSSHGSELLLNQLIVTSFNITSDVDPPPNPSPPDTNYALEYVYGYRCADSRQNCYFNAYGQAVYMTAALGIVLDASSNTQKFFGGGRVENQAKNVSNDENAHTDDITALTMSNDRNWAATGQVGSAPAAFVWNA